MLRWTATTSSGVTRPSSQTSCGFREAAALRSGGRGVVRYRGPTGRPIRSPLPPPGRPALIANGHTLELATLPDRHPRLALLDCYGVAAIIRLTPDPCPPGMIARAVAVDWAAYPGGSAPQPLTRAIGWDGMSADYDAPACRQWARTKNAKTITEGAAVVVMALLVHELEDAEVVDVLREGNGGDNLVPIRRNDAVVQAECRGIAPDADPSEPRRRLNSKRKQVLRESQSGFVSVTAFSAGAAGVRSFLHFVTTTSPDAASGGVTG